MSDEPSYPPEAAVGAPGAEGGGEAVQAAAAAKGLLGKNKQLVKGVAFGIGSAAIVAALLYANRAKRSDKGNG